MEIGVRFIGFVEMVIRWLTMPFYFMWSLQSVKTLPPVKDPILLQSACTLAKKIRKGQVSKQNWGMYSAWEREEVYTKFYLEE
jgi:hypothetical protein